MDVFAQLPFLRKTTSKVKAGFAAEVSSPLCPSDASELGEVMHVETSQLLLRTKMKYHAPLVCFADSREDANAVMIIINGLVDMCQPIREGGRSLRTLKRG